MKNIKILLAVLLLSSLLLVGCNKTDEAVDAQPEPTEAGAPDFSDMTEEERIQEMIKLIEAEEAKMVETGDLEPVE